MSVFRTLILPTRGMSQIRRGGAKSAKADAAIFAMRGMAHACVAMFTTDGMSKSEIRRGGIRRPVQRSFNEVGRLTEGTVMRSMAMVLIVVGIILPTCNSAAEQTKPPKVEVRLLADTKAIVPGSSIDLAVAFKLEKDWHIYWSNPGDTGLPTTFKWQLPPDFTVGAMKFPPPQRHVDKTGLHSFILEGEPVILTTLKVPAELEAGQKINISVKVKWLVCKDRCYSDSEELSLQLPVVPNKTDAKPDNEILFMAARDSLPKPVGRAEHMKQIRAVANVDKVKPGSKFMVAVILDIRDGFHINSHKPLDKLLILTDLFHNKTEGLIIDRAGFPPGHTEPSIMPGKTQSVYRGRTVISLPVEADNKIEADKLRITGVATYQACTDKEGRCYLPTAGKWELTLPVAGQDEKVSAVNNDIFKDITKPKSGGFTLNTRIITSAQQAEHSLWGWLAFALLAGLILNVTPCVLPVISIKVLSFVQQASESPGKVFKLGLAFSLGMLIVFNILAILATGLGLVWGQHFQSPVFTIVMATVVFAFGLSLFGVFTLGVPRTVGDTAARVEGEGYVGSIAKGGLATIMGTPCLGPFLGPVLVWAAGQTPATVFLAFNTIGVGMALPYVLLTANPRWLRFVPKPGPWLITFKQTMGFLLMATVIYLLYVVQGQLTSEIMIWVIIFLTGIALACWVLGRWLTVNTSPRGKVIVLLVVLLIVGGSAWVSFSEHSTAAELPWEKFSMERLTELTSSGKTVFLDITANWCPNCHYNSVLVFNTRKVFNAVQKYNVVPMLADWTARGPVIEELIQKLAPGGAIPICAVFPADRPDEPVVMIGMVTKSEVIDAIRLGAAGN